jgi:hypothetical protein
VPLKLTSVVRLGVAACDGPGAIEVIAKANNAPRIAPDRFSRSQILRISGLA